MKLALDSRLFADEHEMWLRGKTAFQRIMIMGRREEGCVVEYQRHPYTTAETFVLIMINCSAIAAFSGHDGKPDELIGFLGGL